jgi:NADPH:quinone reductase-like Zn-dependent oxidoreductase
MKAIVQTAYGSANVLSLQETPQPGHAPLPEQSVLVKIYATAVHAGDWHLMRGTPFLVRLIYGGLRKPKLKILGCDLAGEVVAVGSRVSQFKPGDAVFGDLSEAGFGTWAEYCCAPASLLALKPKNLTFTEAATVPVSALSALQALRDVGKLQPGQQVLINGAASGVGSFAVQIAQALGAEVTALCSPAKQAMVRALGVDQVMEAPQTFTREAYDLILDIAAFRPIADYIPALKPNGRYVLVGGSTPRLLGVMFFGGLLSRLYRRKVQGFVAKPNAQDLNVLKDLIEAGKVSPHIDRIFPLAQLPEAVHYLEQRQAQGKVAIVVPTT